MPPITWRNVAAPDFSAGNRLLESANRQINSAVQGGVSQLQDLARKQDADELARVQASLLNASPEEAAAIAAQGYSGPGDATAIGKVLANAEGAARKRVASDFAFDQAELGRQNTLLDQSEKEGVAGIQSLLAKGNTDDARTALDALDAREQTKVGLEKQLFDRTREITQQTRAEDSFQRGEDARNRQDTLNTGILNMFTGREEKIDTIKATQEKFARDSNGMASFDGSGNLVISDELRGEERVGLISNYVATRKAGPKLKTAKERRDEFTKLARDNNATPAQLNQGLAELRRYDEGLLELSQEDKALLAGANQAAQDDFVNGLEQEKQVRDLVLQKYPVDPTLTAFQEDARGGNAVQPGELVQADVAAELANEDSSLGNLADDTQAGEEIPRLVSAMNTVVDSGFQRGTENIDYPGWVVRAAYKSVGLRGLYTDGLLTESIDAKPFQDALNRIMKQHLKAEDNAVRRAQAEADFSSKKLQLKQRLNTVSTTNQREARSRSGVFTDSDLPNLLDREAARVAAENS